MDTDRAPRRAKRRVEEAPAAKRLRSNIPRRKRFPLLEFPAGFPKSDHGAELEEDSSSSCLHSEVSVDSSLRFTGSEVSKRLKPSRAAKTKKAAPVVEQSVGDEYRRITRSYAKRQEMLRSGAAAAKGVDPAVSEGNAASEIQISDVTEVTGALPAANPKESGVPSCAIEKFPETSECSCLESVSDAKLAKISSYDEDQSSVLLITGDLAAPDHKAATYDDGYDLACSEQLSDADQGDNWSEYSACNEMTLSEGESELFYRSSPRDSSEYSLSILFESAEDFSERSSENSTPSVAFSLFLQLTKQFVKLTFGVDSKKKAGSMQEEEIEEFKSTILGEEDEESYKNIRSRERREVALYDFGEEFCSETDCGDLILRQRLVMVNWMVEHAKATDLQPETLFLAVNLMDRVLSKGYFENERNLQLLGIASVTLATRLEEIQTRNSIRRSSFTVGNNAYSRSEVVAMEWLLLQVLNFRCLIPTTHNFLWFYLKAAKADAKVDSLSRYLAVLSLLDHRRLCFWPSTVAAGVVILACLATHRDAACVRVMETHVRTRNDDLPECIQSLEWLVRYARQQAK